MIKEKEMCIRDRIKADNAARQEWNRTVDVALVEGVPEEDILKIKQEKITDNTLQSIRTHGWMPDVFRQIIRCLLYTSRCV